MNKFLENIANMFKVKTVISLLLVVLFFILSINGIISGTEVKDVVLIVIAFYFGTQAQKGGQV